MTSNQVERTVVTETPTADAGQQTVRPDSRRITSTGPGGSELTRRIVILCSG
jgi:hypothetical protein